jgi:hypothetical protein
MQTTLRKQLLLVALGTVALLTACGGSGSNDVAMTPTTPPVAAVDLPASASQSVEGVITYAKAQVAATSETSDPQSLGTATLFTDETSEPSAI